MNKIHIGNAIYYLPDRIIEKLKIFELKNREGCIIRDNLCFPLILKHLYGYKITDSVCEDIRVKSVLSKKDFYGQLLEDIRYYDNNSLTRKVLRIVYFRMPELLKSSEVKYVESNLFKNLPHDKLGLINKIHKTIEIMETEFPDFLEQDIKTKRLTSKFHEHKYYYELVRVDEKLYQRLRKYEIMHKIKLICHYYTTLVLTLFNDKLYLNANNVKSVVNNYTQYKSLNRIVDYCDNIVISFVISLLLIFIFV